MSPDPTGGPTATDHPGGPGTPGTNGHGGHDGLPPDDDALAPWSRPKRRWYKSGGIIALAAIIVFAGASAIADIPQKNTIPQQVASMDTSIKAIDTGIHPCTYAVSQAFSFLEDQHAGTLTASDRGQLPGLMNDDVQACSFVNQSEVNLSTITLPGTPAGRDLSVVIKDVYLWSTSDAVAAMDDINTLLATPHDATAATDLSTQERLLGKDRAAADREITAMERTLGHSHIPDPALPRLPGPSSPA